jgi:hypothetical protein
VLDPVVELRAVAGRAGFRPELEVLAVGGHRGVAGEEATGVGAHGDLGDGQDPVGRHLDEVGPGPDVVDHPLDGGDDAPLGRQRPPQALEPGGVEGEVPIPVGDRCVEEGDVGSEGLQ